jgi:hypothetical protein
MYDNDDNDDNNTIFDNDTIYNQNVFDHDDKKIDELLDFYDTSTVDGIFEDDKITCELLDYYTIEDKKYNDFKHKTIQLPLTCDQYSILKKQWNTQLSKEIAVSRKKNKFNIFSNEIIKKSLKNLLK